jgi:hypothetical protein
MIVFRWCNQEDITEIAHQVIWGHKGGEQKKLNGICDPGTLKKQRPSRGGYGLLLLTKLVSYEKKLLYHKSNSVDSIIKYFNLITEKTLL